MNEKDFHEEVDKWARLRFSIIGGLLASPPVPGELQAAVAALSGRRWRHPVEADTWLQCGASTIERWYYKARNASDPLASLRRQVRRDIGHHRAMKPELIQALKEQYQANPTWSYQLHADNLGALIKERFGGDTPPAYATVRRFMKRQGWRPKKAARAKGSFGRQAAEKRLEQREVRSYETPLVHGLWHSDFHHAHRQVVDRFGHWHTPKALCILDDCSRLCCHIQWYLDETAVTFVHGLSQAFYKRGLPRALMTDNGAAMLSGEVRNGLQRMGIVHETTLPYSPFQNGKQESFWGRLEGRLMAMLHKVIPLTLDRLNEMTQAWVEMEYQRRVHTELGISPLDRMLKGPEVGRQSPSPESVRIAFCLREQRRQRRSDGTITLRGIRFEVPRQFHHLEQLLVGYQSWDLSIAHIVDPTTGKVIGWLKPLDKSGNADGRRRMVSPPESETASAAEGVSGPDEIPPLLQKYLQDYAASGLPPAYIPVEPSTKPETPTSEGGEP